jgi:hypothetical protein
LSSPPRFGSLEPEHRRRKTLKIVVLEKQQEKVESKEDNLFNVYGIKEEYTVHIYRSTGRRLMF